MELILGAFTFLSPLIEFAIKFFWVKREEREKKLSAWRDWIAKRTEDAKRSADLREIHKSQKKAREAWREQRKKELEDGSGTKIVKAD